MAEYRFCADRQRTHICRIKGDDPLDRVFTSAAFGRRHTARPKRLSGDELTFGLSERDGMWKNLFVRNYWLKTKGGRLWSISVKSQMCMKSVV